MLYTAVQFFECLSGSLKNTLIKARRSSIPTRLDELLCLIYRGRKDPALSA